MNRPQPVFDRDALLEGVQAARELLHRNLTPQGILAATASAHAEQRRYTRVFGRDAGICALAMALSGDAGLIAGARASLTTLARHQAENGQIPKFVDTDEQKPDFWYLGCIDATLWWLIAVDFMATCVPDEHFARQMAPHVERALGWLHAQEHPRLHLVQQNEASDWADVMPRSGFVLYSNALWYHVKRRYGLATAGDTHHHFNHLFNPFARDLPEYHRLRLLTHYVRQSAGERDLYLSFVNFSFFGKEGDVFGNLLAILFGLADNEQAIRILRTLEQESVNQPVPVRVTCEPIRRRDTLWRPYMARHRQNLEHQYHNGGCWPFVGGFWVVALVLLGRKQQAQQELLRLAAANRQSQWQFNEWFDGQTGEPRGMPGQSWNAAAYLIAHHALTHDASPFQDPPGNDRGLRTSHVAAAEPAAVATPDAPVNNNRRPVLRQTLVAVLCLVLALTVGALDALSPLGVAAATLYSAVVLASLLAEDPRITWYAAGLSTVFVVTGGFASPMSAVPLWIVMLNRSLFVVMIWVTAALVLYRQHATRRIREQRQQLEDANRELAWQAHTDALTGVANRRHFDEQLALECERTNRTRTPLSLLMIDVDHFKEFNDVAGHPAGDACLAALTEAIQGCVRRPIDFVARYGGEEFAVILPATSAVGAHERAEEIRQAVRALAIAHPGATADEIVTVSIGVCCRSSPVSAGALLQLADKALYLAKQAGRDQVVFLD